jgi:hypothetical protein
MSTTTKQASNKRKAVEAVEPVSPPATTTKTKKPRLESGEEESVRLEEKKAGVKKKSVAVGVKKTVGHVGTGQEAKDDSHVDGHEDEDDEESEDILDVEEERAIKAEEEVGVPDRVEEDGNDEEWVNETEQPPLEQGNGKADGTGEKKQRKKRKPKVHHIEDLKHVDLGRVVNEQIQNEVPSDAMRQANIEAFRMGILHTITTRHKRAAEYTQWPLPQDCEFSPAAKYTLVAMGVDYAMAMMLKCVTLYRQEILGRGRLHPFGLEDVNDLPALPASQEHSKVIYLDFVEDPKNGNGMYTGSGQGQQGGTGRMVTYDTAKRLGHAPKNEARSLHYKAFLQPSAKLHLRPLLIFPDNIPSTHVELMEALMKDFLETIDRENLNEVCIGGKQGNILLHNSAMLERSKEAFPPGRQQTLCKGLNKVSAFKQAKFPRMKQGCPVRSDKCTHKGRGTVVYLDGEPVLICKPCRKSFRKRTQDLPLAGKMHEAFKEFAKIRVGTQVQRVFLPLRWRVCQHCKKQCATYRSDLKAHEVHCKKNPNATESKKTECQYCHEQLVLVKPHEAICKKNPNATQSKKTECQYCHEQLVHVKQHEKTCEKNPNAESKTSECQYCHEPKTNLREHEKTCKKNPNAESRGRPKSKCPHCHKERAKVSEHVKVCKDNPANK